MCNKKEFLELKKFIAEWSEKNRCHFYIGLKESTSASVTDLGNKKCDQIEILIEFNPYGVYEPEGFAESPYEADGEGL